MCFEWEFSVEMVKNGYWAVNEEDKKVDSDNEASSRLISL